MRLVVSLSLFVLSLVWFQGVTQAQAPSNAGNYENVQIGDFTIREGVEFSEEEIAELRKSLMDNFRRSQRFRNVELLFETSSATESTLRITGEVLKYQKGNRAVRYFVGFGKGKTKLIADIKVTDVVSGELLMQQTVDGTVSLGILGGDSDDAKGGLASDLIKAMTKRGIAGPKRKN